VPASSPPLFRVTLLHWMHTVLSGVRITRSWERSAASIKAMYGRAIHFSSDCRNFSEKNRTSIDLQPARREVGTGDCH